MSNLNKYSNDKQFHKSNYEDALKYVVPNLYYESDYSLNKKEVDVLDQVINSHLNVIENISSVISISAIEDTDISAINTPEGISKYFVKQNELTDINTNDFEKNILVPLGKSLVNFELSADFSNYLTETFLPGIRLNNPTLDFVGSNASANHIYLINNLSWLYFLNTSGDGGLAYDASSYIKDLLVDKIYQGKSIYLSDALKGLENFIWRNYETCTPWQSLGLIPSDFRPPSFISGDETTSGTSQLDRLCTLVDVVYSPLYIDAQDYKVKDAVDDYLDNGYTLTTKKPTGPFVKLLKAFSFALTDYNNTVDTLEILNDIKNCPEEYLPELAKLIGWELFGSDPDRWRLQIVNAVTVYKSMGTKKALQYAVDSVLGQEVFDVSSRVSELWESYIPFLILYSLATESKFLKSYETYTIQVSQNLGIELYSTSSMDTNIKYCVDKILYELVQEHRTKFYLNGKPFPLGDVDFVFRYRDRLNFIPPFEEIPYYQQVYIDDNLIDSIEDKLVCFGVPESFAVKVSAYIRNKLSQSIDAHVGKNSFLLFTTSAEYPPNWDAVISDISNSKAEYFPYWNSKSSHFKVVVSANEFDFTKDSLEADSKESLFIASKIAQKFSPAHSIPLFNAVAEQNEYYDLSNVIFDYVGLDREDKAQLFYASSAGMSQYGASALAMQTYKRGLTPTSVATFSRWNADSLADPLLNPDATTANLPRRAHRRRDLKNIIPKEGFYTKTGHNHPAPLQEYKKSSDQSVTATIAQPVLYLGLIPSSQDWVHITDYNDIPAIYDRCESINSSSIYSGLVVSNTFPIRGWRKVESNAKVTQYGTRPDYYLDFGQLDPFVATLHYIGEQSKVAFASGFYAVNTSYFDQNKKWLNVLQSYANEITESSGAFPNSFNDYLNIKLGREFHKLYDSYTDNFNRHITTPMVMNLDGPTIFGHTFGSLLKNSKLNERGFLTRLYPNLITSNLNNTFEFSNGSGVFHPDGVASGSYIANSILDYGSGKREYRNSGILSHIEFCQVSGTSRKNSFTVIDIDPSQKTSSRYNSLLHDNILIRQKAVDGFGRIIFDISKYDINEEGYNVSKNFLSPEHKFKFDLKALIAENTGLEFGGGAIGIWVHTKEENGKAWTYTKDKVWVQHSASALTREKVLSDYSHTFNIPQQTRTLPSRGCRAFLDVTNPNRVNDVIASLDSQDFTDISLEFNTINKSISVPEEYFKYVSAQVHRFDQEYVIEVFALPTLPTKFAMFYGFNMIDMTLNKWSKPLITGVPNQSTMGTIYCEEMRVDLNREHVLNIIRYFNQLAGANNTISYANDDVAEIYAVIGDSIAGGFGGNVSSLSTMDFAQYNHLSSIVSNVYNFRPSADPDLLASDPDPTRPKFYQTYNRNLNLNYTNKSTALPADVVLFNNLNNYYGKDIYFIKLNKSNTNPFSGSYGTQATGTNIWSDINATAINDWSVSSNQELFYVFQNWSTSAIESLKRIGKRRHILRGAFVFLGSDLNYDVTAVPTNLMYLEMSSIKDGIINHFDSIGVDTSKSKIVWVAPNNHLINLSTKRQNVSAALLDLSNNDERFVSYFPNLVTSLYMYTDNYHYNSSGYVKVAEELTDIFVNNVTGIYAPSISDYVVSNNFKPGYASRVASNTERYYELSGGSRINYVESPNWNENAYAAFTTTVSSITIVN